MAETLHGTALRLWREQQALFPGFTQRALPDDLDFASGAWVQALDKARQLGHLGATGSPGVMHYERRWYTPEMCRGRPLHLFAFGDNMERRGTGPSSGQAAIRQEPNAVGIVTKGKPSNKAGSFLADSDLGRFKAENAPAFTILANHLREGGVVVWPADGIGTGRAALQGYAPRLWASLERARMRLEAVAGSVVRE